MANLETLELTINANAERATQGIGTLVRSLSALSTAVGKNIGGLMKLNEQLAQLKQYGRMKMPTAASVTNGRAVGSRARKAATPVDLSSNNNKTYIPPQQTEASRKADEQWQRQMQETSAAAARNRFLNYPAQRQAELLQRFKPETFGFKAISESMVPDAAKAAAGLGQLSNALQTEAQTATQAATENNALANSQGEVTASADTSANAIANVGDATQNTSSMFGRLKQAFHNVGEAADKIGSRLGRLASTMIMRMAIKALIKNFTEAWKSAYNFSKKMGGSFAKSIDNIKGSFQSMSINIVRAFAPLIQVVAPIISVIASGIKYLTDAIIALLKVIGIASDLFGATASNIAAVGGASGSATKDVLASFDELNVLDSSSGGGGGGGGGSNFLKDFTEQIETVKVIVGEALLAVGLVLAFMGHPAVGIGLAAVGAAAIAGTIATKWGSLSDEVKGEIAKIMIIAGGAMLAIGAIIAFACPTKLGLGIALMAAGAVNLVAGVALSWGLSDQVKEEVGKITAIVGGALLAIGAILAFACPGTQGIGIAMMAAGGVSLVASVALNWNSLKEKIVSVFESIKKKLVKIWQKVEGAVTGAWDAVKTWAEATWSKIGKGWANIKAKLSEVWDKVKLACINAWAKVSNWVNMTWDKIKQAWEDIKDGLKGVWETVSKAVSDAWKAVGDWISARWEDISQGWENIKQGFSNIWTGIQSGFEDAWKIISQLWEDPLGMLSKAWGGVVTWFRYNIVKPLQQALPGIFGEWKEPGDEEDPVTALIMSWGGKAPLAEAIQQLLDVTASKNVDMEILRIIKEHMPQVKASDIIAITDWESLTDNARRDMLAALVGTFGREGLASIRSQFPNIKAEDLISVTEWKKFSTAQKFAFLDAIKSAFGSEAVIKAAKAAGIDLGALVTEGMKSKDESIKRQAEMWNTLIKQGVTGDPPKVTVGLNNGSVKTVIDEIKKRIEDGVNPKIKVNKINVPDDQKNGAKDSIEKGVKPVVSVAMKTGNTTSFLKSITETLNRISLSLKQGNFSSALGTLFATFKADGGFVDSGDIFIANENNVPEMIGRFGNQTAVANTDQIVAGIASGVSAANQEQNALLRQQNALLTEILQKDNTVRLTASSALGRTVNQSLKMYGQMVGV